MSIKTLSKEIYGNIKLTQYLPDDLTSLILSKFNPESELPMKIIEMLVPKDGRTVSWGS